MPAFWDGEAATVLSPVVGGVAPAIWLWLRSGAGVDAVAIGGPCVWAMRDLLVAYLVALPVLMLCRRIGVRDPLIMWLVAALVGAPMGYVLANPLKYAWTPTDADFSAGPRWEMMFGYMVLFGLTGFLFAAGAKQRASQS